MWYAIIESTTGRLLSLGDSLPDTRPGQDILPLGETLPDMGQMMWEELGRRFIARPVPVLVDRLDDLNADPDYMTAWNRLTAAQRVALRTALARMLGDYRMRRDDEPVPLFR